MVAKSATRRDKNKKFKEKEIVEGYHCTHPEETRDIIEEEDRINTSLLK